MDITVQSIGSGSVAPNPMICVSHGRPTELIEWIRSDFTLRRESETSNVLK